MDKVAQECVGDNWLDYIAIINYNYLYNLEDLHCYTDSSMVLSLLLPLVLHAADKILRVEKCASGLGNYQRHSLLWCKVFLP